MTRLSKQFFALMCICTITFFVFFSRYTFAFNSANSDCLYASFFIVDKWDKNVRKGDLAAFTMNNENGLHGIGGRWIKKVAATGGMTVDVTQRQTIINGSEVIENDMSHTLNYMKLNMCDINAHVAVPEQHYFMMGETITSYDSRYWGTVSDSDIIGKAYAIF